MNIELFVTCVQLIQSYILVNHFTCECSLHNVLEIVIPLGAQNVINTGQTDTEYCTVNPVKRSVEEYYIFI